MRTGRGMLLAFYVICYGSGVFAADIGGKWTAEFDSQVGKQKYTYEFAVEGTALTGNAQANIAGSDMKPSAIEGTTDGDKLSFVENLDYTGMALRITYTGTVSGDEMQLTRDVAGQGGETFTARRSP